jgi:ABC-type hemin transport system ATPase subunit
VLDRNVENLSGGELQRFAIAVVAAQKVGGGAPGCVDLCPLPSDRPLLTAAFDSLLRPLTAPFDL